MSGKLTLDPWFLWGLIGLRFVVPALAVLWLWDLWRRPEWQFHTSWPRPKVRWGVVPAAFLVIDVAGLIFPKVSWIDLSAVGLILAMLVFGVAYLLRIVFPSQKRVEERRAREADAEAEAAEAEPESAPAAVDAASAGPADDSSPGES